MMTSVRLLAFRLLAGIATIGLAVGSARADEPPLFLERAIPLHGVSGRVDHMAIDLPRKRLMIAELGNNTVDIIDLGAGTPVHRISGLREPQGVGYAERADTIVIANAGDGSVRLINGRDFSLTGSVELGDDADNVRIDPRNGPAVVDYGSGGLALIDPASHSKVADIRLPAHPEGFRIDPSNGRTYVNVPGAHQIVVVDLDARRVVMSWPTGNMRGNFPMALDPSQSLIASVFRSPHALLLLDTTTAKEPRDLRRAAMPMTCFSIHGAHASTSVVGLVRWPFWSTRVRTGPRSP